MIALILFHLLMMTFLSKLSVFFFEFELPHTHKLQFFTAAAPPGSELIKW